MNLKPSPQWVIVKLKNMFNDEKDGILINTTFEPNQHIKIDAEVAGVPDRMEINNPIYQQYTGSPSPRSFANAPVFNLYHFQPKWFFGEDIDLDLKEGDQVWFHFNSIDWVGEANQTNRDSYLGTDEHGYEYHLIDPSLLFCRERDGVMKMLMGRILISPIIEETEEIELNGLKQQAVIGSNGLITSLVPKNKYLEGIVNNIGDGGIGTDIRPTVFNTDQVMFLKKSEFKNEIKDVEYYVMKQWDIIAVFNEGEYNPVGHFVKIELREEEKEFIDNSIDREKTGVILEKGDLCSDQCDIGDTVTFNSLSRFFVEYKDSHIFVREEDIHYKHVKDFE